MLLRYSLSCLGVDFPAMALRSSPNLGWPNSLLASTAACQSLRYQSRKYPSSCVLSEQDGIDQFRHLWHCGRVPSQSVMNRPDSSYLLPQAIRIHRRQYVGAAKRSCPLFYGLVKTPLDPVVLLFLRPG